MSMEYIREQYGVPAKRGMRIIYTGGDEPLHGIISGTRGQHLRVMFDGEKHSDLLHPAWEIEYLVNEPVVSKLPEVPARDGRHGPRGTYDKSNAEAEKESKVAYMVRLGMGLVMMQEQELDADGKREQSAQDPQWFRVERFLANTP